MSNGKYILVGQTPVPCDDLLEWGRWYEDAERQVRVTEVGPYVVSTVFLGLDHNWRFRGPPLLFETMVFSDGGDATGHQERCATWLEAEKQHEGVVRKLQNAVNIKTGKRPEAKQVYPPPIEEVVNERRRKPHSID